MDLSLAKPLKKVGPPKVVKSVVCSNSEHSLKRLKERVRECDLDAWIGKN